jgi:hypothetical protein
MEHVRSAFEKQHPEDVLLVFRGVHLAAQNVSGSEKMAFELGEGESGHGGNSNVFQILKSDGL